MDTERPRYDLAILEEAVLAHLFETRALLNVLERKGLVTVGEVSAEIRRLKEQAAQPPSGRDRRGSARPSAKASDPVSPLQDPLAANGHSRL
jgi:hypothetical protein